MSVFLIFKCSHVEGFVCDQDLNFRSCDFNNFLWFWLLCCCFLNVFVYWVYALLFIWMCASMRYNVICFVSTHVVYQHTYLMAGLRTRRRSLGGGLDGPKQHMSKPEKWPGMFDFGTITARCLGLCSYWDRGELDELFDLVKLLTETRLVNIHTTW